MTVVVVSTVPELVSVIKTGDIHEIQYYLKHQSTIEGLLCVGLIQILQIWTIILSAIPLQFASGIVFDALPTFIVCSLASVFSMSLAFLTWKHLSHIIERIMPLSEKEENMIQNALNKNTSPEFLLFLICFVFVMPNGLVPIIASKTGISLHKYIMVITPGVAFNVLICSLVGDRLVAGDWITFVGVLLASTLIVVIAEKVHSKLDKKKHHSSDQGLQEI